MANIPGTIFQMTDGPSASAGNLFPVTVVGAVLGLDATIQAIKNYYTTQLGNYWLKTDVTYNQNTHILQVGPGNTVNLATITDLSNYYTKTEADGRFLGINANAASATKLQTARTIWGQSFDGTGNVSGALSGATTITASGLISSVSSGNTDNYYIAKNANCELQIGVNQYQQVFVWGPGNNDLFFGTDNTERLRITSSGNVGIGTSSPAVKLDVNGQVRGTQLLSTVTSAAPLVVNSTTQVDNLTSQYATNPKSELKTGQEFVFRKTNVEWDAKSGVIKKIKGKTIAWNQQIKLNEVISSIQQGFTATKVSDNRIQFNGAITGGGWLASDAINGQIVGHLYYAAVQKVSGTHTGNFGMSDGYISFVVDSYNFGNRLIRLTANHTPSIYFSSDENEATFNNLVVEIDYIDLTLLYGSEIDGMTDADILAKFEREFPGYHDYNAGKLISNDASAMETVGFNQWDEETLTGYYDANGNYSQVNGQLCTKNYIPVIAGQTYYYGIRTILQMSGNICYYDANKNFIRRDDSTATFTVHSGASYIMISFGMGYGSTYNHDITINLSNPAINGQYFPYKKSRINLGLKNIKVVSPNVWDEEWELGYIGYHDYDKGQPIPSTTEIRCKNFIPVTPCEIYYFKYPGTHFIWLYNSNKECVVNASQLGANTTFEVPQGAAYIKFAFQPEYGTTYNHDITINLSNPAFNGRYFPYGTLELEGGVKGNEEWADYVDVVNQKYHKRAGIRVFDGTETDWGRYKYGDIYNFIYPLTDSKKQTINGINSLYSQRLSSDASLNEDKQMSIDSYSYTYSGIFLRDDTYAGVSEFKAHLAQQYSNGHPLVVCYELQYEEVYDLAEPLPSVYPCDQFGTERVISPVSVTPSAPFCADIQYGAKSDDVANDLIGTRDAVQPLLDALQYDGQNHAWHLKGSLYADGFITAYGINGGARTSVIAPYVIESSNYSTSKIWVGLNVMNESIAKYKQGYLVQAKKAGEYITYSVTSIDESSYILYCNGGSVTVELES